MTIYIGADLHARSVSFAGVDEAGALVTEKTLRTRPEDVLGFVEKYRPGVSVAVEAMNSYYWFVDTLMEAGIEVHLVHPLMLKAISYAKVKTDKVDARTIAQLLRLGMLPKAYIYPRAVRPLRDLARRRQLFVDERSLHYREIQSMHQQAGLSTPARNAVKKLTSDELSSRFESDATQLFAGCLVEVNKSLDQQIHSMARHLHRECSSNPIYHRIMELPGVGEIYGQTILLESGDISRFRSHREYASYARLVPGSANSADRVRRGVNPKQGNARLKNAFRQAALRAVISNRTVKHFFDRKAKKIHRKNILYSIVARKLAVAAYHVMRRDTPLDLQRIFGAEPRKKQAVETVEPPVPPFPQLDDGV